MTSENLRYLLTEDIKDLHPSLIDRYSNTYASVTGMGYHACKKTIMKDLSLGSNTKRQVRYWKERGWGDLESELKAEEYKIKNPKRQISPFSREFWTSKINPNTNKPYTSSEADYERNCRRPNMKEYWIKKGHPEVEAIRLAQETKSKNNKKGAKKFASKSPELIKLNNPKCIEYWVARGHDSDQAKQKISELQVTFSKDICIEKYGVNKGVERWNKRQLTWKDSLKKSGIYVGASKSSIDFFNELSDWVDGLSYGENEVSIETSSGVITVDCFKNDSNKVIEYYGDYWHANPNKFQATDKIKKYLAEDIWKKDTIRLKSLFEAGYDVLVIWEYDAKNNTSEELQKCMNFLTP